MNEDQKTDRPGVVGRFVIYLFTILGSLFLFSGLNMKFASWMLHGQPELAPSVLRTVIVLTLLHVIALCWLLNLHWC